MKAVQLSSELRLLVQMVQQELLQVDSPFLLEGVNWEKFKKSCAYHGMRHVAFSADQKQSVLPNKLSNHYRQFAQQRAKSNLDNVVEIKRLYALFEKEGIYPILLKGALYTHLLYQNRLLRESTDIDFLFKKKDSLKGMLILLEQNYQCRDFGKFHTSKNLTSDLDKLINDSFFQELHFDKKPFNVDFHWELCNQFLNYEIDLSILFEDTCSINFYHKSLQVTNPTALFWSLMLHHGGKEMWLKFKNLVDLLAFLERYKDEMDWESVFKHAQVFRLYTALKNGLWLIREVFEYQLPVAIEKELNNYIPDKIHLTFQFWEQSAYWNKLLPRLQYERVMHNSQDPGYSFLSYLKKFYLAYAEPNAFEHKRIFNLPSNWRMLNFLDKVISYYFEQLFKR